MHNQLKFSQARQQQQLTKPRPTEPPPTFSGQCLAARGPTGPAAPAIPDHGQSAVIHVTSAASADVHPLRSEHGSSRPSSSLRSVQPGAAAENQPEKQHHLPAPGKILSNAPVEQSEDDVSASTSVVGVKRPTRTGSTQASMDCVSTVYSTCVLLLSAQWAASVHLLDDASSQALLC